MNARLCLPSAYRAMTHLLAGHATATRCADPSLCFPACAPALIHDLFKK